MKKRIYRFSICLKNIFHGGCEKYAFLDIMGLHFLYTTIFISPTQESTICFISEEESNCLHASSKNLKEKISVFIILPKVILESCLTTLEDRFQSQRPFKDIHKLTLCD